MPIDGPCGLSQPLLAQGFKLRFSSVHEKFGASQHRGRKVVAFPLAVHEFVRRQHLGIKRTPHAASNPRKQTGPFAQAQ